MTDELVPNPYYNDDGVTLYRRNQFIHLGFESDWAIGLARDKSVDLHKIAQYIRQGVPASVIWDHYGN